MLKLILVGVIALVFYGANAYNTWEYNNCIKAYNAGNKELKCEDIKTKPWGV